MKRRNPARAVTATTATTGRFSRDRRRTGSAYPAVLPAHDELQPLERGGDRRALVVDEPGVETDFLDRVEVEVGREPGGLLRPRDPQPSRRRDRRGEPREAFR